MSSKWEVESDTQLCTFIGSADLSYQSVPVSACTVDCIVLGIIRQPICHLPLTDSYQHMEIACNLSPRWNTHAFYISISSLLIFMRGYSSSINYYAWRSWLAPRASEATTAARDRVDLPLIQLTCTERWVFFMAEQFPHATP